MKNLSKVLVVVLVLAMALSLVPVLEAPASAAATPIIVLSSTTAVNPILDHVLSQDDFKSGGPHTVTFEWRAVNIKDNDASDPGAGHAFVGVTGTAYGSTTQDNPVTNKPAGIKGTTEWAKVTFQFGNVGTYGVSGTNYPGNILRFGMWKAKGELQIKNLVIKTGSTVKYDLNSDSIVAQAVSNTQAMGMTECALDELAAIDYENCPWTAGQFSTGAYAGYLRFEGSVEETTKPITRPPQTTTKPVTNPPATNPPATNPPATNPPATNPPVQSTTKAPTVKPTQPPTAKPTQPGVEDPCADGTHDFVDGFCADCATPDPTYNRCEAKGHDYEGGDYCVYCLAPNPAATQPTQPSTQPAQTNNGGMTVNPIVLVAFVLILVAGLCLVVLFATGALGGKKKKD